MNIYLNCLTGIVPTVVWDTFASAAISITVARTPRHTCLFQTLKLIQQQLVNLGLSTTDVQTLFSNCFYFNLLNAAF